MTHQPKQNDTVKVIKECPVCHSDDIVQEIGHFGDAMCGDGSHCGNCGVKFIYNSTHLKRELHKIVTAVKRVRNTVAP